MTARTEAIEAMFDADTDITINYELATRLLDAIPAGVKARLAIDEGGLKFVRFEDWPVWDGTRVVREDEVPLYRVVEP